MFMYSISFKQNKPHNFYGVILPTTNGLVFEGGISEEDAINKVKAEFGDDIEITEIYKTGDYESELKQLMRYNS